MGQGGLSKKAKKVQEDSTCKGIQVSTSKEEIKCVCLNARSIINKKDELNIMVDDIKPHIYIYNSILIWGLTILKSGARTPRTVTKFAVKTAIDMTQTI